MPVKDKEAHREYMRKYRQTMQTPEQKRRHTARVSERKRELIAWFREFKSTLRCERCGEDHPACLDFHHTDPDAKDGLLSQVIWVNGWSKHRVLEEVAKCEVLCANCHRKEHADAA